MKRKSDARAQSTNPRFPWKPSTTMLTFRLTGTTEAIGVDRDGPSQVSTRSPATRNTPPDRESSRPTAPAGPRC